MQTNFEKKEILRLSNEESNRITRECLRIAMFKLMGSEDFEKITVTALAKHAGVSRLAFYRNYESKEALVSDLCSSLYAELSASLQSDRFRTNRKQWYIDFFRTIKENSDYFAVYLKANLKLDDGVILESVYPSATVEEHYAKVAREGAFLSILTDWFNSGMKESAEKMGRICVKVLGDETKPVFGEA